MQIQTASDSELLAVVQYLAKLVRSGSRLYLHCFSGRGRTGTVAIPLLVSLYPDSLTTDKAKTLANAFKKQGRTGYTRGGHMPETPAQNKQIKQNTQAFKRGGHKAKLAKKKIAKPKPKASAAGGEGVDGGVYFLNTKENEYMGCADAKPDAKHCHVITAPQPSDTKGAHNTWCLTPVASGASGKEAACHVSNAHSKKLLHAGSEFLDPSRRYVWVGHAEKDLAATWFIENIKSASASGGGGGGGRLIRLRNAKFGEYLYCGSKKLEGGQRVVLTWKGKANSDPAMVWRVTDC